MWFRLYTGILDDPKVQWLSGDDFKGWINILCIAKENDGLLPSSKVIAFRLRITEAEANHLVEVLTSAELLDHSNEGITPHNWDSRQFLSDDDPTAALRSRRYRQRNVTRDATDDVTDASQLASHSPDTESETEQKQSQRQSRGGSGESPSPAASRAKRAVARRPSQCDEEYLEELQRNPAYAAFDVKAIFHKMVAWCNVKGKQPTRGRLVTWLNHEDRPMTAKPSPPKTGNAYVGKSSPVPVSNPVETEAEMAKYIEELISLNDLVHVGQFYDAIIKRGAKAEWEIRAVAWYELHKDEPATPEQVAQLKSQIAKLANKN